ncbi:hypothetical protein THS27_16115 [Thalassospira sp. MCCC 1A01428]|nr:hypothetical protein THS27_16115 [Thalassospira sp. MCCC 1A01428]
MQHADKGRYGFVLFECHGQDKQDLSKIAHRHLVLFKTCPEISGAQADRNKKTDGGWAILFTQVIICIIRCSLSYVV